MVDETVSLTAVCTVKCVFAAVTQITLSPVELCISLMHLIGSEQYAVAQSVRYLVHFVFHKPRSGSLCYSSEFLHRV
jgi:hypothetical protein